MEYIEYLGKRILLFKAWYPRTYGSVTPKAWGFLQMLIVLSVYIMGIANIFDGNFYGSSMLPIIIFLVWVCEGYGLLLLPLIILKKWDYFIWISKNKNEKYILGHELLHVYEWEKGIKLNLDTFNHKQMIKRVKKLKHLLPDSFLRL